MQPSTPVPTPSRPAGPSHLQECIDHCTHCHAQCVTTLAHCLQMGGPHAAPAHIALLHDCAQICATSADFMLRNSPHHTLTCAVCARLCDACADDCEKMASDDQQMMACAGACRRCAKSCRGMADNAALAGGPDHRISSRH